MKISKVLNFFGIKTKDKNKNTTVRNEISQRYKNPMDEADDWMHHTYAQRASQCAIFLYSLEVIDYQNFRNIFSEIDKWRTEKKEENNEKD